MFEGASLGLRLTLVYKKSLRRVSYGTETPLLFLEVLVLIFLVVRVFTP